MKARKVEKLGPGGAVGGAVWEVNGWYHLRTYDPTRKPSVKQRALDTRNRTAALSLARSRYYSWKAGTYDPWLENRNTPASGAVVTNAEAALERYLIHQEDMNRRPRTIETCRERIGHLIRFVQEHFHVDDLRRFKPEHIRAFIYRPALSDTAKYTRFQTIRAFFRWCKKAQLIKTDPTEEVARPAQPNPPPVFVTKRDFEYLLLCIEQDYEQRRHKNPQQIIWIKHALVLLVYTGLRRGELCRLRWRDVHLTEDPNEVAWITISSEAKYDSTGRIPLPCQAVEALRALKAWRVSEDENERVVKGANGGVLNSERLTRAFKRYARKANLPERVHLHSLRHTYASWLVQAGESIYTVSKLMRHKDVKTTERYSHLSPDHLQASVLRAFSRPKPSENGTSKGVSDEWMMRDLASSSGLR